MVSLAGPEWSHILPILVIFLPFGFRKIQGMARAAYITDRLARWFYGEFYAVVVRFWLQCPCDFGRAHSQNGRRADDSSAPLIPCAARIAVVTVLAAAFFGQQQRGSRVGRAESGHPRDRWYCFCRLVPGEQAMFI